MNRSCFGLFFGLEGKTYYRCLYNGAIHQYEDHPFSCPECGRMIDGEKAEVVGIKRVVEFRLKTETGYMGPFKIEWRETK